MSIFIARDEVPQLLVTEVERFDALVADLHRIARGEFPTQSEIERAPLLDAYTVAMTTDLCLRGLVQGHPRLRDGRLISTSPLWVCAQHLGWARTTSRLYRLGRPLGTPDDA